MVTYTPLTSILRGLLPEHLMSYLLDMVGTSYLNAENGKKQPVKGLQRAAKFHLQMSKLDKE